MKLDITRKSSDDSSQHESMQLIDNSQSIRRSSSDESDIGEVMSSSGRIKSFIDDILNAAPTIRPIRGSANSSISSADYYDTISYNSGCSSDEEFESACDFSLDKIDTATRAKSSPSPTLSTCSSSSLRSSDTPPKHPTKTLFVGNLAVEVTEAMLNEMFSQFGVVVECCKRWYHYAFIQYSSEPEAQQALQALDGHRIQGRAMRVEFQRKKLKTMLRSSDDNLMPPGRVATQSTTNSSSSTRDNLNAGFGSSFQQGCSTNYYRKAIYVSVNQTDSYFTRPGEQVMPCIDYKAYELFPSMKENCQLASAIGYLRADKPQNILPFGNTQSMNEMFPALGDSSQDSLKAPRSKKLASDSEDSSAATTVPKRRYAHALRLLQS